MANNVMRMTFNEAIPVGGTLNFLYDGNAVDNDYVMLRSGAGEVTANAAVEKTAFFTKEALTLDYPSDFDVQYSGNQLTVVSKDLNKSFTGGTSSNNVTFEYSERTTLSLSGLNGNNYLINNDIIIDINSTVETSYFTLTFENLTNQQNSGVIRVYTNDTLQTQTLNISPIIKSLFSYPSASTNYSGLSIVTEKNSNRIKITINTADGLNLYTTTKYFIRAGNRTNDTNQTLPITVDANYNTWLTPVPKIPVWNGYNVAGYKLGSTGLILKEVILPDGIIDNRRSKGCNELYVKFLNQKGGYSYWLFDSEKETESNINLGSFIRDNKVSDLGNESESSMMAYGKIPSEYFPLIKDLIISPEIYVLRDGEYIRVLSDRNSVTEDLNKRAYRVTIKFDLDYRFNPSILWSN